jgi:hypothetical protein
LDCLQSLESDIPPPQFATTAADVWTSWSKFMALTGAMVLALITGVSPWGPAPASAQATMTLPGGAVGSNVHCLQAGSLKSGVYAATFLETKAGTWEERSKTKSFEFDEMKRDDLVVELFDAAREVFVQIDFITQSFRERSAETNEAWAERYVILNATDKSASGDCVAFATAHGVPGSAKVEKDLDDEDLEDLSASETTSKAKRHSKQNSRAAKPSKKRKKAVKSSKKKKKKKASKSKSEKSAKAKSKMKKRKKKCVHFNGPMGHYEMKRS